MFCKKIWKSSSLFFYLEILITLLLVGTFLTVPELPYPSPIYYPDICELSIPEHKKYPVNVKAKRIKIIKSLFNKFCLFIHLNIYFTYFHTYVDYVFTLNIKGLRV